MKRSVGWVVVRVVTEAEGETARRRVREGRVGGWGKRTLEASLRSGLSEGGERDVGVGEEEGEGRRFEFSEGVMVVAGGRSSVRGLRAKEGGIVLMEGSGSGSERAEAVWKGAESG